MWATSSQMQRLRLRCVRLEMLRGLDDLGEVERRPRRRGPGSAASASRSLAGGSSLIARPTVRPTWLSGRFISVDQVTDGGVDAIDRLARTVAPDPVSNVGQCRGIERDSALSTARTPRRWPTRRDPIRRRSRRRPAPTPTTATTRSGDSMAVSNASIPPRELPTSAARPTPSASMTARRSSRWRELDVLGRRFGRSRARRSGPTR